MITMTPPRWYVAFWSAIFAGYCAFWIGINMADTVVLNTQAGANGKTIATLEGTSQSVTGGLVPASDAAIVGWIRRKTLALTNAQIKALPTTYLEVIAAPGAGSFINVIGGHVVINATAGAYTNVAADNNADQGIALVYGAWDRDCTSLTPMQSFAGVLIGHFAAPFVRVPNTAELTALYPPISQMDSSAQIGNKAVKIAAWNSSSGDFTGGHASNTGLVTVYYTIETY